jgi:hypothetical protein
VLVTKGSFGRRVTRSMHEFSGSCAGRGRERQSRMPKIVQMEVWTSNGLPSF